MARLAEGVNVLTEDGWESTPDSLPIDFDCTNPVHQTDPESCTCYADAATLADAIEVAALSWQEAQR